MGSGGRTCMQRGTRAGGSRPAPVALAGMPALGGTAGHPFAPATGCESSALGERLNFSRLIPAPASSSACNLPDVWIGSKWKVFRKRSGCEAVGDRWLSWRPAAAGPECLLTSRSFGLPWHQLGQAPHPMCPRFQHPVGSTTQQVPWRLVGQGWVREWQVFA